VRSPLRYKPPSTEVAMLLLLSCLNGAWAQDPPPTEEGAKETPTAPESPAPESPEAEANGTDADPEAELDPEPEPEPEPESEAEPEAEPEPEPEPASEPEPQVTASPVSPDVEVTPVPLLPPPVQPPLIQHLAEHANPYGLVQVWGIAWDQDQTPQADPAGYGDPEDDVGFKIRRARIGVEGDWGEIGYRVAVGYSSGFDGIDRREGIEIIDASIDYQIHRYLGVQAGLMKVPFGRDNIVSSSKLVLGERSMIANHVTPDRDVGLVVDGGNMGLRIQAGLFNGNGDLSGDDNPGVLAMTRISYQRGPADTYETFGEVEALSFSVGGNVAYNWDTATTELIFGVDLGLRVSGLAVLIDIQAARITPANTTIDQPGVLSPTVRDGFVLQVGYTLKDMWEPAVRLEWFDGDPSTEGNELAMATIGFTAHLSQDRLQAGAAFVHRQEVGETRAINDTLRGFVQVVW
jgi:hypothetical protein